MKNLLYFEEYESNLSHELLKRNDINLVILRSKKNMKFFSKEYLELTKKNNVFISDYEKTIQEEVNRFKNWSKEKKLIPEYFLNDSEFYLEYANEFARKLNLECLSEEQVRWVRDKVDMKEKFNKIGLKTVDYKPVESKDDVKDFFIKHGSKRIIFKPRRGMNSIDTYKIESLEDIENIDVKFKKEKYMVEDFCYDHEWSIESLIQDGKVLDSYLTYIPNATIWATISNDLNCHITVPKIPDYFKFIPKDLIQAIVSGMKLKNGTMTIEVFINKNGTVMPSELGWRLPGCQATTNHAISYGIDIYNTLIDIALKNKVYLKYRNKILSVGDLYLPNKEGIIEDFTSLEELYKMGNVINGELFIKKGQFNKKRRVGNDSCGWIQVVGSDERESLQIMQNIYDNFKIVTKEELEKKRYVKKI
ncbi:MAG: hypothetical protein RR404_03330 [Bacilli bacterium]